MTFGTKPILTLMQAAPVRQQEEFVHEFRNVPEGWPALLGILLLIALGAAVIWMYRREGRIGATMRRRMFMAGLRCAVIACLAAMFLEPVRVRIIRQWIDSYTLVLVDDSSSMDLADRYRDPDRKQRVSTALARSDVDTARRFDVARTVLQRDDRRMLRDLAENNRIKLYRFSSEPELIGTVRAERERTAQPAESETSDATPAPVSDIALPESATGSTTNVARAVRRAIESVGSAPVAGVVVLSDGGFNMGDSADEVARFARDRRIPIHVLGIGDPAPPRNVRITDVHAPENAFRQDPFAVTAHLSAQGMDGQTVRVQLRESDGLGGAGSVVDQADVTVQPGGGMEPVVFERRKESAGRYVYSVEVPVGQDETVADDNVRQTTVTVIDARTRVLLVSGTPSWTYRYLTRLFVRDETVDLSTWLQSADITAVRDGDIIIDHLPRQPEEIFDYDVIIMLDPNPAEFDAEWCHHIDTWVTEHGGGLVFGAARTYSPDFLRQETFASLIDLLPVVLDPESDIILNRVGHYQLQSSPIEIPDTAYGHPVLRLADDPASTRLKWRDAAEVYWHFPVLREKPVATVLMRHGHPRMQNAHGGHVLAAVQFVGAGRTAFLGFDGTWRWRQYGEEYFNRFWVQLTRYVAEGKLLGGARRGMLLTESDQYALGEAVTVSARLFNSRYEPIERGEVTAFYNVDNHRGDFRLRALGDRPGWFEGRFVPDRTGNYRLSMTIPDPAANEPIELFREIRVSRPNIEVLKPQMDRAQLTTLAQDSFGGAYYEIDEWDQIAATIPDLHEEIPIRSRPRSLWDNRFVLGLLIGLLGLEWALRKWNRLL